MIVFHPKEEVPSCAFLPEKSSSVYIHTIMEESESQSGENAKGTVRPTSSTTRSATEIYLVGQPASSIRGSKLPTMRQVLKFFFHTVNESGDRQETFKETVRNVLTFWNLARIKTISERGCREKLTRLWEHWRSLQNSRDRAAKDKVENFKSQLDLLWDIGAPDAVEDIEKYRLLTPADKQQDIAFYQDQRGERKAFMSEEKAGGTSREAKVETGRFAACEPSSSDSRPQTSVVADTPTEVEMEKKDTAIQPGRYTSKHPYVTVQLPRRILQEPALKELADRLWISNNESTFSTDTLACFCSQIVTVVAAVLRSANPPGDLPEFRISRETARRARASHRRQVAAAQREAFTPPPHAVVQWDGKLVKNVVGEEEHRQAIFISGRGHEEGKLLAVLPVKDGTGLTQARATARAIEDWSCASNVKALCFDTTSSNTGRVQGAAGKTAVEAWVQTPRHGTGGGCRCQQHLRQNIGPYGPCLPDSQYLRLDIANLPESDWLSHLRHRTVSYLLTVTEWAREDYREAAELTLLVLGVNPPRGTHFLRPGACHHARWMAKIIYYLKIYMFSHQLELSSDLCVKLQRMAIFVSLLYTPAWLKSPVAEDAPVNDLQLHHELLRYRAVDCEVADAALAVASRHLWYLRPQTVVLSLCSEKLSAAEKKEMATKLSCLEETNDYANDNLVIQQTTRLSDLIDERSWMIFKEHHVCGTAWLMSPVEDWEKNEEFMKLKDFSRSLKVTNDVAERGIKLMQDFIGSVTKDEQQLQDVMQLVEKHRKQMSGFSKSALMQL
ncbi:hypothetical protein Hamer_G004402 [Homarus americanus]|uniref:Uncharacterized protein n=1 Tax=Homarus americanus TaxID=6706 RepID=A0A8J5JSA6_HOMAM|nr:hypothetical protein Hamer_G004402 [Homarus americanus]